MKCGKLNEILPLFLSGLLGVSDYGRARVSEPSVGISVADQIKRCAGATRLRGFLL